MEKRGRIEKGVTPSEQSGKPSVKIKKGQVLAEGEKPIKKKKTLEKVAKIK